MTKTQRLTRAQTNAARARKTTAVLVPLEHVVPWRDTGILKRLHPITKRALVQVIKKTRRDNVPMTMVVHDRNCNVTVSRWPRQSEEPDEGADIMTVVREACSCQPLVMYTGARA